MTENPFEKQAKTEEEMKTEDRLIHSLEYRNPFQLLVFKMLALGNNVPQVMKYSKIVSDYINDSSHTEIRSLILQKKFEEAAKMMVAEIKKEEMPYPYGKAA